jgi:hypothetical protein
VLRLGKAASAGVLDLHRVGSGHGWSVSNTVLRTYLTNPSRVAL